MSFIMCIMNVTQAVNGELPCAFPAGLLFFSWSSGSSVLHNSVGGGTVLQSARDHLIKFILLQPHQHVHAVMFTEEAEATHTTHTTTVMNGLAVLSLYRIYHKLGCSVLYQMFPIQVM